jgi:hypothetical protein
MTMEKTRPAALDALNDVLTLLSAEHNADLGVHFGGLVEHNGVHGVMTLAIVDPAIPPGEPGHETQFVYDLSPVGLP